VWLYFIFISLRFYKFVLFISSNCPILFIYFYFIFFILSFLHSIFAVLNNFPWQIDFCLNYFSSLFFLSRCCLYYWEIFFFLFLSFMFLYLNNFFKFRCFYFFFCPDIDFLNFCLIGFDLKSVIPLFVNMVAGIIKFFCFHLNFFLNLLQLLF